MGQSAFTVAFVEKGQPDFWTAAAEALNENK